MITLATLFTLFRLFLTPVIVWAMLADHWAVACGTFLAAAATDVLDGALARWYEAHTTLGACLDALADKVLLVSSFTALTWHHWPMVPAWFVWLVVAKELLLIFGAVFVGLDKGWTVIRPTVLGKLVTCAQIIFIAWLFACHFFGWQPMKTYTIFLAGLALLVMAVLAHYAWLGFMLCLDKNKGTP
jgi:cardiolipin synthase (CMP-forming)